MLPVRDVFHRYVMFPTFLIAHLFQLTEYAILYYFMQHTVKVFLFFYRLFYCKMLHQNGSVNMRVIDFFF